MTFTKTHLELIVLALCELRDMTEESLDTSPLDLKEDAINDLAYINDLIQHFGRELDKCA